MPSLNWGATKTGLEEVKLGNFLAKGLEVGYIDQQMFLDIVKQNGLSVNVDKVPPDPNVFPQKGAPYSEPLSQHTPKSGIL